MVLSQPLTDHLSRQLSLFLRVIQVGLQRTKRTLTSMGSPLQCRWTCADIFFLLRIDIRASLQHKSKSGGEKKHLDIFKVGISTKKNLDLAERQFFSQWQEFRNGTRVYSISNSRPTFSQLLEQSWQH